MKKICVFLCVVVVLFLGSCSSMLFDDEEAIKADLPSDFDWKVYKEINNDVAMKQIDLELNGKRGGEDSIKKCVNILNDIGFAKEVYENYLQCPMNGWNKNNRCVGKYDNNESYSEPITKWDPDANGGAGGMVTIGWKCNIEACWSEGWNELRDSLEAYSEGTKIELPIIKTMCQLVADPETVGKSAKSYLEEFKFDSYLIEQHYHFFGRRDGRPYKYCKGQHGAEKTQALADKRGTYYDYGRYTFCFEESDQKVYIAQ